MQGGGKKMVKTNPLGALAAGALVAVGLLVVMLLVVEARPAEATFPGKNGRIAYSVLDSGIYTINPGGGGKTKVIALPLSGDAKPSYSPNGKRIAYSDYDGQDYEIYTINVGGGSETKVTNNVKDEEAPSYSPDGRKIAYECFKALGSDDDEDFDHEICTINVGGGGKTKVTDTPGYASDPSWGSRP
jgi:Tol biopolymer transport system component